MSNVIEFAAKKGTPTVGATDAELLELHQKLTTAVSQLRRGLENAKSKS